MLRGYQSRAIEEARDHVYAGRTKVVVCAPCGAGKSTIGSAIAGGAIAKGKRVVWLAHRQELVQQARETLVRFNASETKVCTIQGLLARGEAPEGDVIIIDEAHHVVSEYWSVVLQAYKEKVIIGLTATPERTDGRGLAPDFTALVVAAQISELVKLGHLVPCEMMRPARALNAGKIAQSPAEAYSRHAAGSRCIVFAPHIKAAMQFASEFPHAKAIHAKSPDREQTVADFRSGKLPVLVNVGIATEGVDVPETETVIVARSCGSPGLWIQMAGRAMRPAPGKTKALVIDLRGVSYALGRPDDDREYSLDGELGISRPGKADEVTERLCKMCQAVLGELETCPRCGAFNGLEVPKATGERLAVWKEKMRDEDSPEKRVERLARWVTDLQAKGKTGKSLWSARYKYSGVYGELPPNSLWNEAMRKAGVR